MTGAGDRNRTGTGISTRGILSPVRLPVPPPRQKKMEATPGIEPGIKVLQTSALPLGYVAIHNLYTAAAAVSGTFGPGCEVHCPYIKRISPFINNGAENETRTRDPNLGKVVLYQLSYFRNMVPQHRIELWTQGFSVPCSTN